MRNSRAKSLDDRLLMPAVVDHLVAVVVGVTRSIPTFFIDTDWSDTHADVIVIVSSYVHFTTRRAPSRYPVQLEIQSAEDPQGASFTVNKPLGVSDSRRSEISETSNPQPDVVL